MTKHHVNPTTGVVTQCRKRSGTCTIDDSWHFTNRQDADAACEELLNASRVDRLSNEEILKKFKSIVIREIEVAMRFTYTYVLAGINLGRKSADRTWVDIADDKRAVFGIQFETTFMNLVGAVKLPKKTGLDLFLEGHPFDVKARASEKSKDISLSPKQNASLVLVLLYNMTKMTFEVYMGYPDEHGSSGPNKQGYFSLSRSKVRDMAKLAEGTFNADFEELSSKIYLGSLSESVKDPASV